MSRLRIISRLGIPLSVRGKPGKPLTPLGVLGHVGSSVGLFLVFVGGSVLSLVLYANLPAGRRVATYGLQRALQTEFEGRFGIEAVERVSLSGLRARGVTVYDPDGRLVLSVNTISIQADVPDLVKKILFGKGELTLRFERARLERAEVYLLPGRKDNVPTIVDAFTPIPPIPGTGSAPSSRTVKVWFPEVEVGHIYGRMALDGVPTLETELSSVHGSIVGSAELTAVDVERFSAQVRGLGGTDAKGVGSVHVRAPGAVWTSFDGYFGDVQFGTVVRVDSPKLDVTVDVPRAKPAEVRALWAAYPLLKDATAHVEGTGTLEAMHTQAKFTVDQGTIVSSGELRLSGHPGADLDVQGRGLDLRALWANVPATDLDVDTTLAVFEAGNEWITSVDGSTRATEIGGFALPPIDVAGNYSSTGFAGNATLHEPGAPFDATFQVHPDGSIDGSAEAKHVDLSRAPRLAPYFTGRGLLDLQLKARIEKQRLVAQVKGNLQALQYGSLSAQNSQFSGRATGPLTAPEKLSLDLSMASRRIRVGAFGFDEIETKVKGPATRPTVSATITNHHGPVITAQAKLTPRAKPRLDDLSVEVRRDDAVLTAKAEQVDVNGENVRVEGASLDGAGGHLAASGQFGPERVALDAHGTGLDLAVIARALGVRRGLLTGNASIEANFESTAKARHGSFDVKLEKGSSDGIAIDSLDLQGQLKDAQLDLQSTANLPGLGSFSGDARTTVTGSLAEARSFERATGIITLKAEHVPFGLLAYAVPQSWGVNEVRGEGSASLVLDRSDPEAVPNASLLANTNGLYVSLTRDGKTSAFSGVEAHAGVNLNGSTGESDLTLKVEDSHGPLASASTHLTVDLAAAVRHPELLLTQLRATPLVAKLVVDDRQLEELPTPIQPQGLQGRLRTELSLRGTLDHPVFSDKTELFKLRFNESERDRAIDVCAQVDYDKSSGQYGTRAEVFLPAPGDGSRACQGSRVAQFSAGGRAEWDKIASPTLSADPAWTGSAGLSLEGLPIDFVPVLAEAGFGGRAYGVVMFDRRGALPQVRSQLELRDAVIARTRLGTASLRAQTDGRSLSAALDVEQPQLDPSSPPGHLKGSLQTSVDWQGVVPGIDDTRPISATIDAKAVDAAILAPFVRDVLSEISGKLDADLKLNLTPQLDAKADQHWTGAVSGELSMHDGAVQLAELGLRMRNVAFTAHAEDHQNKTLIRVDSLEAAAESSKINVWAPGNLWLSGFRIQSGNAHVTVQGVPFLVEGVTMATLNGEASIDLDRKDTEMLVALTVPTLEAKLPEQATRELINLGSNEDIAVAQPIAEPRGGQDDQSLPWRMTFDLGNKVKVTRVDLFLPVTGKPELRLGKELGVVGNISLTPGGRLSVPGLPRPFTIETGTVYFDEDGDPKNPRLKVRAACQLAQLTVWATVSGTFRDAKVVFDSDDPSLSQAQIEAVLLSAPSPSDTAGSSATAGIGAGAGYLGKRLFANTALSSLEIKAGSEVSADQKSYATYSAAYPITDEIWFEGSYKTLQTPATGEGSSSSAFSGIVDWRFRRNWSLRTEVGNIGAGVDLLWMYRY
ncbi:MAG: translocation/assembly module TamB domain-containing protein [Myxococcales bacterium]